MKEGGWQDGHKFPQRSFVSREFSLYLRPCPNMDAFQVPQPQVTAEASSPGTIEVLSSFITVAGTIADVHFVRSVTWSMILTACLVLMGYLVVLRGQSTIRGQMRALATEMLNLRSDLQTTNATTSTSDGGATTTLDDTLMRCIDAKLLDISGQTTALKTLLGSLEAQQTIARLEEIQDALSNYRVTQEQLLESVAALAPKMTEVHGAASQLTPMTATQQAMALDTKKGFAATETHIDGVLKAQQDTLHCLQNETKELKDKLIKIDTVCDGLTSSAKQLSLDVHVSRTKQEQKMDSYIQDYNKFQGATNSNLRALGPVMPAIKTVTDHLNNAMDYLAKAWQSYERTEPVIHNMQEQVNNIEDRLLRIESLVVGNTDTANECSDMIQQLKESQNLLHEPVTGTGTSAEVAETAASQSGSTTDFVVLPNTGASAVGRSHSGPDECGYWNSPPIVGTSDACTATSGAHQIRAPLDECRQPTPTCAVGRVDPLPAFTPGAVPLGGMGFCYTFVHSSRFFS